MISVKAASEYEVLLSLTSRVGERSFSNISRCAWVDKVIKEQQEVYRASLVRGKFKEYTNQSIVHNQMTKAVVYHLQRNFLLSSRTRVTTYIVQYSTTTYYFLFEWLVIDAQPLVISNSLYVIDQFGIVNRQISIPVNKL